MGVFVASVCVDVSKFNPGKRYYRPKPFEKNGRFYAKNLHIKKWKDFLPQYIGKNGFSKRHLIGDSIEYLDLFISETCRAEWNHVLCCLYAIIPPFINSLGVGLLFSALAILTNLPFVLIQRYNRFRLQEVRDKKLRMGLRAERKLESVAN